MVAIAGTCSVVVGAVVVGVVVVVAAMVDVVVAERCVVLVVKEVVVVKSVADDVERAAGFDEGPETTRLAVSPHAETTSAPAATTRNRRGRKCTRSR